MYRLHYFCSSFSTPPPFPNLRDDVIPSPKPRYILRGTNPADVPFLSQLAWAAPSGVHRWLGLHLLLFPWGTPDRGKPGARILSASFFVLFPSFPPCGVCYQVGCGIRLQQNHKGFLRTALCIVYANRKWEANASPSLPPPTVQWRSWISDPDCPGSHCHVTPPALHTLVLGIRG